MNCIPCSYWSQEEFAVNTDYVVSLNTVIVSVQVICIGCVIRLHQYNVTFASGTLPFFANAFFKKTHSAGYFFQ